MEDRHDRRYGARINPVYADMPMTIFEEMAALARELGAINLGQGFPDTVGPPELLQAAADAAGYAATTGMAAADRGRHGGDRTAHRGGPAQ